MSKLELCLVQILFLLFPAKDALFSWYHDMLAAMLKHQACSCSPLVKLPLCSSDIRTYTYEKRQIIIFIFLSNAWQVGDSRGSAVCGLMQQRHMRLPQPAKVQCFTCSPVCCWTFSRGFFPALIKCSMYKLPQILCTAHSTDKPALETSDPRQIVPRCHWGSSQSIFGQVCCVYTGQSLFSVTLGDQYAKEILCTTKAFVE